MLGIAELLVADIFWGFGFVAAIWAMEGMGPFSLTAIRFLVALIPSLFLTLLFRRHRGAWRRDTFLASLIPGLLLGGTLILQTWGLRYTSATRSGFLTGLYVVFVPLLERYWFLQPLHNLHFVWVALALFGTALIVDLGGGHWNWGDVLTFACSLTATAQICWLGRVSQRIDSPMVFNSLQGLWAAALALILAVAFESQPTWPASSKAWLGLLSLSFGSTWLAFALQIRAQRRLSATTSSLLFLIESPLALLFGAYFLREQVTRLQMIGAGLILVASYLAIWQEARRLALVSSQSIVSG